MGQNAIYYKGKSYTGGGGSGGSSTLVDLTDVNIDNPTEGQGLVYDATNQKWINGDVGGGGSGSGYKETVLWTGCTNSGSYTLDTPITDFDAVIAYGIGYMENNFASSNLIIPVFISISNIEYGYQYMANGSWSYERRAYITFTDSTHFSLGINGGTAGFYKLTGINFGGGGAVFKGLDYSRAVDLNLPDNTGYNYTPTEDGVLMITSYGNVGALGIDGIFTNDKVYLMHGGDRWTTSWCFVEKDVQIHLYRGSSSYNWASGTWLKFIPLKQSSSSSGGSSEINYSTEEQRIGTWIDGKPLYEKTIHSEQTNISASGTITISDFTQADYSLKIVASKFMEMLYQGITWSDDNIFVRHDGDGLKISLNHGSGTFTKVIVDVVIRYTKTTD